MRKSREVDAYIRSFPRAVQARLRRMRAAIRAAAPRASEVISYRIPAYRYAGPKGNLRFPHDEPLPLPLISRIVRLKARQDLVNTVSRTSKKKK